MLDATTTAQRAQHFLAVIGNRSDRIEVANAGLTSGRFNLVEARATHFSPEPSPRQPEDQRASVVIQIFGVPRTQASRIAAFSLADDANAVAFRVVAKSCQTVTSFRSAVDRKTAPPRTPIAGRSWSKAS